MAPTTEAATAEAAEPDLVAMQRDVLDEFWDELPAKDREVLCPYWQSDIEAAVDRFTGSEVPVSRVVFEEWMNDVC
ncbi:hypothetical protein [Georgenia sp. AZ-5]|uniref:hypothetical protein n=1 Tax=Georgenia sp. AZ-5 TaxID=3367526 RepID=UPI003754850A